MATALQARLDSILQTASSVASLSFSDIPTHFIASLHQPGVDNLIRDPHPHERGLFTVRQPSERKENPLTLDGESPARILRTRQEKNGIRPLLLPKYSGGGNVEADVFLKSASTLLNIYPVPGVKEKIVTMLRKHGEISADVDRLEDLVEEQRKRLEVQHSSRFGVYDDEETSVFITQEMVNEEEDKVCELEERIQAMQERLSVLKANSS